MAAALQIVAVGRLSPQHAPAFEHYRRLVAGLVPLTVREVREVALQGRAPAEVMREEANRVLRQLEGARRARDGGLDQGENVVRIENLAVVAPGHDDSVVHTCVTITFTLGRPRRGRIQHDV